MSIILRKNGCTKAPHILQVSTYFLFTAIIVCFFVLVIPLMADSAAIVFTALFIPACLATAVSGLITTLSDPSDEIMILQRRARFDKKPIEEIESCEYYCNYCLTQVGDDSKHCKRCDRCVDGFDHHCKWVNNCVGKKNYKIFFVMVVSVLSFMLCYAVSAIYALVLCHVDDHFSSESNIYVRYIFLLLTGLAALVFTVLDLNLLLFHVWLIRKGMTTYQYILMLRLEEAARGLSPKSPKGSPKVGSKSKSKKSPPSRSPGGSNTPVENNGTASSKRLNLTVDTKNPDIMRGSMDTRFSPAPSFNNNDSPSIKRLVTASSTTGNSRARPEKKRLRHLVRQLCCGCRKKQESLTSVVAPEYDDGGKATMLASGKSTSKTTLAAPSTPLTAEDHLFNKVRKEHTVNSLGEGGQGAENAKKRFGLLPPLTDAPSPENSNTNIQRQGEDLAGKHEDDEYFNRALTDLMVDNDAMSDLSEPQSIHQGERRLTGEDKDPMENGLIAPAQRQSRVGVFTFEPQGTKQRDTPFLQPPLRERERESPQTDTSILNSNSKRKRNSGLEDSQHHVNRSYEIAIVKNQSGDHFKILRHIYQPLKFNQQGELSYCSQLSLLWLLYHACQFHITYPKPKSLFYFSCLPQFLASCFYLSFFPLCAPSVSVVARFMLLTHIYLFLIILMTRLTSFLQSTQIGKILQTSCR
eukprot:TRINITY_DN7012_c0_g1_i6.p1 TRINITY_DN7012_c0_g1~~TRINITY_DN7012_c0_g1_i6.p1  ORF type:complete len:694 (-),score=79.66 TRINITY_DN7012_c0_g1_i6:724-2805(-)